MKQKKKQVWVSNKKKKIAALNASPSGPVFASPMNTFAKKSHSQDKGSKYFVDALTPL